MDKTALLVIDVQEFVLNAKNHPPRPEFYHALECQVLDNIDSAIRSFRGCGAEIVYTVMESLTRNGRDRSLDYKLSGFDIPKGSEGAKIPERFAPVADEILLPKTSACVFHSTNLAYILRNMGIERILLCGFLSDQCIEQSMKVGASIGFDMVCLQDCIAANTIKAHNNALERISSFGAIQNWRDF